MFYAGKVAAELEAHRETFQQSMKESRLLLQTYGEALRYASKSGFGDLNARLLDHPWPGARPLMGNAAGFIESWDQEWTSVEQARAWALSTLRGVSTAAVDGSQIAASKEFGVPVSLVQVAYFLNPHDGGQPYLKDVRNEIVAQEAGELESEEYAFGESRLNQRRFAMEMTVAIECMERLTSQPPPVVFVDGTLVLSFVGRLPSTARDLYIGSVLKLLQRSQELQIPVVGYVDLSYARDVVTMLRTAYNLEDGPIVDAQLLQAHMKWFERTTVCECARGDVLPLYAQHGIDMAHELCFVYVKMGAERPPSRLDVPRWVVDAGLLDHVLDVVRAECVVGSGYPYALETADAAAVLSTQDRMHFYQVFQHFSESIGMGTVVPSKSLSKSHRR